MVMEDHSAASVLLGQLSPGATTGTVNLTGSTSDFSLSFRILSAQSPNLTDGVVNGSLATGNQTISQYNGPADYNVTITSGSGNDTLSTLVDSVHTATLNGGAGNDILIGSSGRDIMTGGTGNDIFRFGAGTAAPINVGTATVDIITDFNVGDTLEFGALSSARFLGPASSTLASAISTIEAIGGLNQNVLIGTTDGTHYLLNTGDGVNPSAVIKIVLAAGLDWNNMVADNSGAHYVLPPI
jgi:Ca2+-binding RTX toxin-like protein